MRPNKPRLKPKILFVMRATSTIGGVETWLNRICGHLAGRTLDPVVALVRGLQFNDPTKYRQRHSELTAIEIDGRGLDQGGRERAVAGCIRKVKPSIVVPLGVVDAFAGVVIRKRQGQDVRLLSRCQGNLPPMLADIAEYRDWTDLAVCPGKLTGRVLVEWAGFAPDRVMNISNGADPPVRPTVPRSPVEPLRLGYVGRMTRDDKRAQDLIPLVAELDRQAVEYTLDVVGDGPCRAEIVATLGNSPRVRIHDALPQPELYERIFPRLDVLVFTSASEAFGIVLVEAMMHGVVPVSSRYDGFHAEGLVRDEATGLSYAVGDMAGAASAIARLATMDGLLERLSAAAVALAEGYSWAQSMERWQGALESLVERRPVLGTEAPELRRPGRRAGMLDRLPVTAELRDALRRGRRTLFGSPVPPGGEEWPLFNRHHPKHMLDEVAAALKRCDVPTAAQA